MAREGYIAALRSHVGTMPLLVPSVAVFVRDGDRVVVGRHRDVGLWVIPGGALEPGELPAECAVREVREETGLGVTVTGIHGVYGGTPDHRVVYPNGDVVDYVATVFEAAPISGSLAAETAELTDLRWVTEDELAALESPRWLVPVLASPGWESGRENA